MKLRKYCPTLASIVSLASVAISPCPAVDLRFSFLTDPSAVALQFDVSSVDSVSFGTPQFQGLSPHAVESATLLSSGATRFVVYSTTGLPISSDGEVSVTFSSPSLADGMLSVSGVKISDASGQLIAGQPNFHPVVATDALWYRSQQVGGATPVSATAFDLDGSISAMQFKVDGSVYDTALSSAPATTSFTPVSSGSRTLSVTAIDSLGGSSTNDLGTVRAYELSELATFADFQTIHFGGSADPSLLGFETEAFGTGVPNGLAWVLGMNPNAPDPSRLPAAGIEPSAGGDEFVFRFNRPGSLPGVSWSVRESTTLAGGSWDPVPGGSVTETPLGDGTVDVEVRKTIDPVTDPKGFMTLEVTSTP